MDLIHARGLYSLKGTLQVGGFRYIPYVGYLSRCGGRGQSSLHQEDQSIRRNMEVEINHTVRQQSAAGRKSTDVKGQIQSVLRLGNVLPGRSKKEQEKLVKLLQQASRQPTWSVQFAYRLAQEFQQLLRAVREEVKHETDEALKREQTRYKDATDGTWLEEREEYYKALTESLYLQRRAALVETLFAWWTDVLRANNAVAQRDLPVAKQETAALARRFGNAEILKRIRLLEELRDHFGRNIHESLAIEVAFLAIFIA